MGLHYNVHASGYDDSADVLPTDWACLEVTKDLEYSLDWSWDFWLHGTSRIPFIWAIYRWFSINDSVRLSKLLLTGNDFYSRIVSEQDRCNHTKTCTVWGILNKKVDLGSSKRLHHWLCVLLHLLDPIAPDCAFKSQWRFNREVESSLNLGALLYSFWSDCLAGSLITHAHHLHEVWKADGSRW